MRFAEYKKLHLSLFPKANELDIKQGYDFNEYLEQIQ